jgi:hypothetical protein
LRASADASGARYRHGNHPRIACARVEARAALVKILVKLRLFKFDENSPCIRVDFAEIRRNIANDSFSPIC